ncbi:MAG: DUF111 family protein, partial [Clostridia bacterium]|nr:DUF111 family protein [Clostridia bacterium]
MKTLYLECGMGAAGDMLTAALIELLPNRQAFLDRLNALNLPGIRYEMEPAVKCGICGTHMKVIADGMEEESDDASDSMHEHHHDDEHEHGHEHHHGDEHEHEHEHGHHHGDEHEHGHGHHHDDEHEHGH